MHKLNSEWGGELAAALGARRGVVSLVGAGGKKSTMYALAAGHPGRVVLSSTSHMYAYDRSVVDQIVVAQEGDLPSNDPAARVVAYAGATDTPRRVGGLQADALAALWARGEFDLMLLKADGARARRIKAPANYEPLVPAFTETVIAVVSARVFGHTLDSGIAHRPELAAAVMGTRIDTPLTPSHVARLLSAADGALKDVGQATVVPLLNMVDDDRLAAQAGACAREALARTRRFDRVVLASIKSRRVVDVVTRAD